MRLRICTFDRDFEQNLCALSRLRLDSKLAAQLHRTGLEVRQTLASVTSGGVKTHPVICHGEAEVLVVPFQDNSDVPGAGVPQAVADRLLGDLAQVNLLSKGQGCRRGILQDQLNRHG